MRTTGNGLIVEAPSIYPLVGDLGAYHLRGSFPFLLSSHEPHTLPTMATTLSNPRLVNTPGTPVSGVTPSSGFDGVNTWAVTGQNGNVVTLSYTTRNGSNAGVNGDLMSLTLGTTVTSNTYVQVTLGFTGKSDQNNWTVNVVTAPAPGKSNNTTIKFQKGNGGGGSK